MIKFEEAFLWCKEFGNFISLANFTNFEVFCSSNSAMKTGTTEIFSTLFRINAHSYLESLIKVWLKLYIKKKINGEILQKYIVLLFFSLWDNAFHCLKKKCILERNRINCFRTYFVWHQQNNHFWCDESLKESMFPVLSNTQTFFVPKSVQWNSLDSLHCKFLVNHLNNAVFKIIFLMKEKK